MKKTSVIIIVLLLVVAFLGGSTLAKVKYGEGKEGIAGKDGGQTPTQPVPTQVPFSTTKSKKPEVKFFVMSFCPYGNQAEAGLGPVYELLKNKVDWQPKYIVSKIDQAAIDACKQSCPQRVFNDNAKQQCEAAIKNGQLKDMTTCQQYFPFSSAEECVNSLCLNLKVGTYESLHGPVELNQDVREICAYNLDNLDNWWKFVKLVNDNCTSSNADDCWLNQAKDAGLQTSKISECEQIQKVKLLSKELAESEKLKINSSPSVLINGTLYNGARSPEDYKKAICLAFEVVPEECGKILGSTSPAISASCK